MAWEDVPQIDLLVDVDHHHRRRRRRQDNLDLLLLLTIGFRNLFTIIPSNRR